MKTQKLNLKSIKNVMSRAEMRKIMAGSGSGGCLSPGTSCCDASGNPTECAGAPTCCSGQCYSGNWPDIGTFCM